jgi:predicted PurR-regulated permease PerM
VEAARIQARAVFKVAAISLVAIAAAVLLAIIVLEIRDPLRWLFSAIFVALALNPAVDLIQRLRVRGRYGLPRWLAILVVYAGFAGLFLFIVLQVIPPIVSEVEGLAKTLPGYISDFEKSAEKSDAFRELNDKYHLTSTLSSEASSLPARLGDAAKELGNVTVTVLRNFVEAILVLTIAFFLLLDGRQQGERVIGRLDPAHAERARRVAARIYGVVKGYVTTNLALAAAAGVFTWLALELLGVDLAVPLAVLVAFLDLIPLIGLTLGGVLVAVVAAFHDFPEALIVWAVLFLIYQQLQDRVVQPLLYRRAVQVHPVIAIVAILVGGELIGILGALLAIPVAGAIGVLIDEALDYRRAAGSASPAASGPEGAGPAPGEARAGG